MKKMVIAVALALLGGLNYHVHVSTAETKDPVTGKSCYKCHASKVSAPFVHSGLADRDCTPCHNPTGGNHQNDRTLYFPKDKSSKICYECHEDRSSEASVHPPIMEENCLACHAPHGANFKFQLGVPVKDLCFGCHSTTLVSEQKTTNNSFRNASTNLHNLHAGQSAIPCLTCHDIHASSQLHMIRPKGTYGEDAITITYTATPNGGNCTASCHDKLEYERK